MKKKLGVAGLGLAVLFYGVWPLWTGHGIVRALEGGDVAGLEQGIDFASVRQVLKPAVTQEADRSLREALKNAGPAGAIIASQVQGDVLPKIVNATLETLLAPEALIRLHREGRSLKDAIVAMLPGRDDLGRQLGKVLGGVLAATGTGAADTGAPRAQTPAAPVETTSGKRPVLGLANLRSVRFQGPLQMAVGIAHSPSAPDPSLTATLTFTGIGWRVTALKLEFSN